VRALDVIHIRDAGQPAQFAGIHRPRHKTLKIRLNFPFFFVIPSFVISLAKAFGVVIIFALALRARF